jgi:hypothetical protein
MDRLWGFYHFHFVIIPAFKFFVQIFLAQTLKISKAKIFRGGKLGNLLDIDFKVFCVLDDPLIDSFLSLKSFVVFFVLEKLFCISFDESVILVVDVFVKVRTVAAGRLGGLSEE